MPLTVPACTPGPRKRVLVVAPDFPPSSYPPALRMRIFAQHLPAFGWEPVVLTIDPSYYEWPVDPEIARMLRPDLEIIRTHALPLRWTRRLGIGDLGLRTIYHLWREMRAILQRGGVDLVFVSVAPFYSALLGRLAHERFDVPYVIDYQDPWISDSWRTGPGAGAHSRRSYLSKRGVTALLAEVLEPWCLRKVSHVTAVSSGTTDPIVERYAWLTAGDATEIPFGGDPDDFAFLRASTRKNVVFDPDDGCFHLTYVGAIAADMQPALRTLLVAVCDGLRRAPETFSRLRLHFVGTTYAAGAAARPAVVSQARELGLGDVVDEHPERVPYADALKLLVDSHALAVVGSNAAHYTASKIFPYILAERPIVALFHERSTVVDILRETGAGSVVTFGDEGPLAQAPRLSTYLEQIIETPSAASYLREAFERYTTRAMTGRLARVFDRAVGPSSSVEAQGTAARTAHNLAEAV